MDTLKGIFPRPKKPPKRDFLRENVMYVRRMQQANAAVRQSLAAATANARKPIKAHVQQPSRYLPPLANASKYTNRFSVLSSPKQLHQQQQLLFGSLRKSQSSSNVSRIETPELGTKRDICSQTTDVNDGLFLKDAIIRYPSENILFNLQLSDRSEPKIYNIENDRDKDLLMVSSRTAKTHPNNENQLGVEHAINAERNLHLQRLSEFLDSSKISRQNEKNKHCSLPPLPEHMHKCLPIDCPPSNTDGVINSSIPRTPSKFNQKSEHESINNIAAADDEELNAYRSSVDAARYNRTLNGDGDNIDTEQNNVAAMSTAKKPTHKSELPSTYKKGEIPKYLRTKKDAIEREKERKRDCDPNCPVGHILLSEHERKEALSITKKKFDSLISELNSMPMSFVTLKLTKRKCEIEQELTKLEDKIRTFSLQRVYIKMNDQTQEQPPK